MNNWHELHSFWFGNIPDINSSEQYLTYAKERNRSWFQADEKFNLEVRRFEDLLHQVSAGALISCEEGARSCLPLILLLDQLPRGIYRGTSRAFFFDPLALQISRSALERGLDFEVSEIERVFFYLPFEHSESSHDQALSVDRFQRLYEAVPEAVQQPFRGFLDYAVAHQNTVERFGRFPGRNSALGRKSTSEEAMFLDAGKKFVFDSEL